MKTEHFCLSAIELFDCGVICYYNFTGGNPGIIKMKDNMMLV